MGHFANVNGVHREIVGGRTSVDGIEREITLGKTGVNGIEYDIPFDRRIGSLPVGSMVYTNIDGELREFVIVQQGLPSSMYSQTCNDTWLLMKDIYADIIWSKIVDSLDSTFLPKFDAEIQNKIKEVKIPYFYGKSNPDVQVGENGKSARIFFLSASEVGYEGVNPSTQKEDGTLLSYFEHGNGEDARQKRIAYLNGVAKAWWTRSLSDNGVDNTVFTIGPTGNSTSMHIKDGADYTSSKISGVRPAFILPSETRVNRNHIIKP